MTKNEKEQIREKIQNDITELNREIEQLENLTAPIAPDNAIGRITRMEAINSRSVNEASLNKARLKRRQLEEMGVAINKSDYGLCSKCKDPIPFERLLWLPESDRCVKCAG